MSSNEFPPQLPRQLPPQLPPQTRITGACMSIEVARIEVGKIGRFALSLLTGLLFIASLTPIAWAQGAVEGRQYSRITPVPVETGKKIEVIEFFSYSCPH